MPKNIRTPLGTREEAILGALGRYPYLTARQCCRLLYAPGSFTYVQAALKGLGDGEYVQRLFLPRPTPHGRAPAVYTLGRRGRTHLASVGVEVAVRLRPAEEMGWSYLHLSHTLAVGDVLIACELVCRALPQVRIARLLHERALKHLPIVVAGVSGKTAVVPDGWVDLRVTGGEGVDRYCVAFEVDRGTMEQRAWRRKVAALVAATHGPYQAAFGTDLLTIAVVATPGAGRMAELRHWTGAELVALGEAGQADLFRFTALPVAETDPVTLLCGPSWYGVHEGDPLPLIEIDKCLDNSVYQ